MLLNIKHYNQSLSEKIDKALTYWEAGRTDDALEVVNDIEEFWNGYYKTMSYIITSDKMQSISSSIAKLRPLLIFENDEFYSECESIKFSIALIYDSEFPYLHSII
jgi:hypothetical protein